MIALDTNVLSPVSQRLAKRGQGVRAVPLPLITLPSTPNGNGSQSSRLIWITLTGEWDKMRPSNNKEIAYETLRLASTQARFDRPATLMI